MQSFRGTIVALLVLYIHNVDSDTSDEIGYFWHLNDLHLDLNFSNPNHHKNCTGALGDYRCDSSMRLVMLALNATKHLFPVGQSPDFMLWNGDNGPHLKGFTLKEMRKAISLISDRLQQLYSGANVYILPTVGNHDVVPANIMSVDESSTEREVWCHQLGSDPHLWGPWIHLYQQRSGQHNTTTSTPPYANFSKACFFSHLYEGPSSRLLLISLNGLLWYRGNTAAKNVDTDPMGQLKWLTQSLHWARENKVKVLLVSHFPPGASENTPRVYKFLHPIINKQFVDLLVRYADVLMAGLFAHTHVDSFRVVTDGRGHPVLSLFTSPSICPMHLRGLGSFNPRLRLYRYNRRTGLLMDYRQYFLDISASNASWSLEYDTQTAYGLKSLSPASLASLLNEFEQDDSRSGKWSHYWTYELGGRPHDPQPDVLSRDGLCPRSHSRCRCDHLCAMRHVDLNALSICLANCTSYPNLTDFHLPVRAVLSPELNDSMTTTTTASASQRNTLPIIIGVIIAFVVILIGVILAVNRDTCRRRGGRHSRRLVNHTRDSGVVFTTLNGNLPRSPNGSCTLNPPTDLDQFSDDIGGSSTELRNSFHPRYIAEDAHSVGTTHTSDEADAGSGPTKTVLVLSSFTPFHSFNGTNPLCNAAAPLSSTLFQTTPLSTNQTPKSMATSYSVNGELQPISMHTEDYYADDEAFADDDAQDGADMMLPYDYSSSNSEADSMLLDDPTQGRVLLLTKPGKMNGHSNDKRMPRIHEASPLTQYMSHSNGRRSLPVLLSRIQSPYHSSNPRGDVLSTSSPYHGKPSYRNGVGSVIKAHCNGSVDLPVSERNSLGYMRM